MPPKNSDTDYLNPNEDGNNDLTEEGGVDLTEGGGVDLTEEGGVSTGDGSSGDGSSDISKLNLRIPHHQGTSLKNGHIV